MAEDENGAKYYSRDFEWEELREEVERNPSFRYHLSPFVPSPTSLSLPRNDAEAWRGFHKRHSTGKFFKERRYLLKEFPDLDVCDGVIHVLEVGCGNGSTVLPILRGNQNTIVYACDCSQEVLDKAEKSIILANLPSVEHRFHPFFLDFSVSKFPEWLLCANCQKSCGKELLTVQGPECCIGGIDYVTLIFTLSAVPFQNMPFTIAQCMSVLKPGGMILFRDYGLFDMTMLRFPPEQRVGFMEYVRSDGTRSYFFSLDAVRKLFHDVGFIELELEYCCVISVNRCSGKEMKRVWVHGKFQKPISVPSSMSG